MRFYPSIDQLAAREEDVLLELKRTPRSMLGLLCWAGVWFLITSLLWYSYPHAGLPTNIPILRSISFPIFYLFPIALCVEAARQYHDDLYIFEQEQIIHRGGRLSLNYSIPSILYRDIRAIAISQTFTGRIFDYGNIVLNTAAQDDSELVIEGVRAPEELAEIAEFLKKRELDRKLLIADSFD